MIIKDINLRKIIDSRGNPTVEDDFIDKNKTLYDYINEIVNSFQEISNKNFNINNSY